MLRPLIFFLVFIASSGREVPLFGQAAVSRGSAAAYSAGLANDRAAAKVSQAFRDARKISRSKVTEPYPFFSGNLDASKMRVGDVGRFEDRDYEIIDVVDATNAIVWASGATDGKRYVFWLVHPGQDLATGDKIRIVDFVKVTGTSTYDTAVGGSNTIRVVELVSVDADKQLRLDEEEAKRLAAEKYAEAQTAALRDFRTWKSANGQGLKAKFVRMKSKSIVELQREDGKKFDIRINLLSKDDAALVQQLAYADQEKRQAELKAKKQATSTVSQKGVE